MFWKNPTKFKNLSRVPQAVINLIVSDFDSLQTKHPGTTAKVLRYVLDAEGEEVQESLSAIPNANEIIGMAGTSKWRKEKHKPVPRYQLLWHPELKDFAVVYRLGRVYQAIYSTGRHSFRTAGLEKGGEWLRVLLGESQVRGESSDKGERYPWDAAQLESIAEAGGHSPKMIIRGLIQGTPGQYVDYCRELEAVRGIADCLGRHPDIIRESLLHEHYSVAIHAISILRKFEIGLEPFLKEVAELSVHTSKAVRGSALLWLQETGDTALPYIEALGSEGDSTQRLHAVNTLWSLRGSDARVFLESRLTVESSRKVRSEIARILEFHDLEEGQVSADDGTPQLELPPVSEFPSDCPLTANLREGLAELVAVTNETIRRYHRERWDDEIPDNRKGPRIIEDRITPEMVPRAVSYLESGEDPESTQRLLSADYLSQDLYEAMFRYIGLRELSPVQFWRLLWMTGGVYSHGDGWVASVPFFERFAQTHMEWQDLRLHASACRAAGLAEECIDALYFAQHSWDFTRMPEIPEDAVWPYFAERIDDLVGYLSAARTGRYSDDSETVVRRQRAMEILCLFPEVPAKAARALWEIALGESKTERPLAQKALESDPGKLERIAAALSDSKKGVRTTAAEWLARTGTDAEVPALEKALKKEKHDEPKTAIMEALERLGVPIERFLNLEELQREAEKGLEKGIPKELFWFPFDELPELHWQKSGECVKSEVLRWLIVQACKLKSAEPAPLLRKYMQMTDLEGRQAFGEWLLRTWIARDTGAKLAPDDAVTRAREVTRKEAERLRSNPEKLMEWDEKAFLESTLNTLLKDTSGSAIDIRGVLSVAAATAGASVVPLVQSYLKKWYGHRLHQCKALLRMLSWIDHPLAAQLLLSVALRFRTKTIQTEAARAGESLAGRKGWTTDEMADRMIPDAGLDENGVLEIEYLERTYTATLGDDLKLVLRNPDGRVIKSLPSAGCESDEYEAKMAKSQFSRCKKELKQVLDHQKTRLYEVMCTQRAWRFEEWDLYLRRHPIVGRYCRQLVWTATRADGSAVSFLPGADGTLVDAAGECVRCAPEDEVRLTHQNVLPADVGALWEKRLGDSEIESLFSQFGVPHFELSEEQKQQRRLKDFEGHMVSSFKLRSRMKKSGFVRSPVEDGGYFYSYHKRFPGLGLRAVIGFSGCMVPEEDETVALMGLSFQRVAEDDIMDDEGGRLYIVLREIPPVLLAECWNAIRLAAKEGSGYDPDWEEKMDI